MTTEDESPIIKTTGRRMAKGLAIIVIMIAFGAAIAVPNWHNFAKNPPPVSTITTQTVSPGGAGGGTTSSTAGGASSSGGGGASTTGGASQSAALPAGATAITILSGASVQGNPAYEPADSKVSLGSKVVWQNKDTTVHTATSGSGASDPNSGKVFDTKMINAGSNSDPIEIKNAKVGDVLAYYCQIHPYMTGKISVTAASASQGNAASSPASGAGGSAAASGPSLTIPQGASVQGNPAYQPATLSVKKGDTIQVQNKDTTPHTVTSGKTLEDPNKGKDFDTSIIAPSASAQISTASIKAGEFPYHCDLHPYMTGTLKVQ
jgi:plastocyanin